MILQAALAVHRTFGSGFSDEFYRRAFEAELRRLRPSEPTIIGVVRGIRWSDCCRALALLKRTGIRRGWLFDFTAPQLKVRRFEVPYARARHRVRVPALRRRA